MTTELTTEMRAHVVGPCNEAELKELRALLPLSGEAVEPDDLCEFDGYSGLRFNAVFNEWWTTNQAPTITFPAFKAKYLQP